MSAPSRRWPRVRFRLWHLLALVTLLCGWLGYERQRANRIDRSTRTLRDAGCFVMNERRFGFNTGLHINREWFGPPNQDGIPESDATMIDRSGQRKTYKMVWSAPAPLWLVNLFGETFFVYPIEANFNNSPRITDRQEILNALKDLPTIRYVNSLEGVTDDDVVILSECVSLQTLELKGQLTDASVPLLGELQSLSFLQILESNISEAGFKRLKELLPNCNVKEYEIIMW